MAKPTSSRLPRGFRRSPSGLVCPHRTFGCCPACCAAHPEIRDLRGSFDWQPEAERAAFDAQVRALLA